MADTTTLEKQRDALQTAINGGYRSVSYAGRRVEYRDQDEMLAALRRLKKDIDEAAGTVKRRSRITYVRPGRGA